MANILLLEDMGHLRRIFALVLSEAGHAVQEGADGTAVRDHKDFAKIDLLITDIDMPQMNGVEAIRSAKAVNPDIKVIVTSGGGALDGTDYLKDCMDLGAIKILLKPFEPDELITVVAGVLAS